MHLWQAEIETQLYQLAVALRNKMSAMENHIQCTVPWDIEWKPRRQCDWLRRVEFCHADPHSFAEQTDTVLKIATIRIGNSSKVYQQIRSSHVFHHEYNWTLEFISCDCESTDCSVGEETLVKRTDSSRCSDLQFTYISGSSRNYFFLLECLLAHTFQTITWIQHVNSSCVCCNTVTAT